MSEQRFHTEVMAELEMQEVDEAFCQSVNAKIDELLLKEKENDAIE